MSEELDNIKLEIIQLNVKKNTLDREVKSLQDKKDDYDRCVNDLKDTIVQIKEMEGYKELVRKEVVELNTMSEGNTKKYSNGI